MGAKAGAADALVAFDALSQAATFYRGFAREAARRFPQNANVAATVALSGIGFDRTEVELIADPHVMGNVHELEVRSVASEFTLRIVGKPLADNPKTSAFTACSALNLLSRNVMPVLL